jgi:hypothetical protein
MPCEHRSYSSHRSHSSRFTPGALPALILLLAAGTGVAAQPAARKPLPETAVLDRVDGRLLHVDVNDTWLFELTMEVKTPDYRLATGTRFTLLPSATLGRLIADVNKRYAPRYRLSARVTQYKGRNYLFPIYYLPLSRFKDDKNPEGGGQRAEDGDSNQKSKIKNQKSEEPDLAIPPEVLEQLKKQRPLRGPRRGSEVEKKPVQTPPERMLVDCVGRIEIGGNEDEGRIGDTGGIQEGEKVRKSEGRKGLSPSYFPTFLPSYVFVPYALGWNLSDIRYELLPCTALEQALHRQRQALDPIRFSVAGLVTEFKGKKYLLLQRAVVVYNYGNFGR